MARITVRRKDIRLDEEVEVDYYTWAVESSETTTGWVATLEGRLSTGEEVVMRRSSRTAEGALSDLEKAISEQGWGVSE